MKNSKVTCDSCGRDLTTTTNCEGYRLSLKVETIPSKGGAVTLLGIYPPILNDVDFCGIKCLKEWTAINC